MRIRQEHLVLLLILAAALLRYAPHPDNMAPIGALALFSGAYLQRQVLWVVPVGALLLGDAASGFYSPTVCRIFCAASRAMRYMFLYSLVRLDCCNEDPAL